MIITRESDYALRIIRALAGGSLKTAGEISDEQQIPQQFAHKIIRKLKKSGILNVARGVEGGCSLAVSPDKLNLYDILVALDGKTSVNFCTEEDYICQWKDDHGGCSFNCQLTDLQKRLDSELKKMTIKNMLNENEHLQESGRMITVKEEGMSVKKSLN